MSLIGRAAAALLGPEVETPATVAADSVPAGVVLRRGRLIPWIGGLLAKSRRSAAAVTLRRTIVLDPGAELTPQLLEHELEHVRQWKADPLFPLRYTLATLRYGYHDNPYEVQARAAAAGVKGQKAEVGSQESDDADI